VEPAYEPRHLTNQRGLAHCDFMTSETWIVGGTESEKRAIGKAVRRSVAALGQGHVEALVENRASRPVVSSAYSWSMEQINNRDLCRQIQEGLDG
jgi:hypothetical protein